MFKGRPRTTRLRTPSSPLALMAISDEGAKISGGVTTSSSTSSSADWDRPRPGAPTDEEQDMANCLILLAQGATTTTYAINCTGQTQPAQPQTYSTNQPKKQTASAPTATSVVAGSGFYECKTCNKRFPSFQALGGHRVSHKRPKLPLGFPPQLESEHKTPVASLTLLPDHYNHDVSPPLSLRISSEANQRIKASSTSRAHECTICGSGFLTGQALGGHMRRHRAILAGRERRGDDVTGGDRQAVEAGNKVRRNLLGLDLNLPAPDEEDQNRDREQDKFVFASNDKNLLVFSASPLVDCHY